MVTDPLFTINLQLPDESSHSLDVPRRLTPIVLVATSHRILLLHTLQLALPAINTVIQVRTAIPLVPTDPLRTHTPLSPITMLSMAKAHRAEPHTGKVTISRTVLAGRIMITSRTKVGAGIMRSATGPNEMTLIDSIVTAIEGGWKAPLAPASDESLLGAVGIAITTGPGRETRTEPVGLGVCIVEL